MKTSKFTDSQIMSILKHVRWATEQGIRIEYIQPGKPQQNAYVERYNRTIRYSWLFHYGYGKQKNYFDSPKSVCNILPIRE